MRMRVISVLLLLVLVYSVVGVQPAFCSDDDLAEVFRVLKENGLSDVAAAAIVGNAAAESGGSPRCIESGDKGKGIGVFQQSMNTNRQALEDFCSTPAHENHAKVTLSPAVAPKSYVVCDSVECQVLATLVELEGTMNARHWSGYYNQQVNELSILAQAVSSGEIPGVVDIDCSWEGFKNQTDLFTATLQFMCDYETPGSSNCMWVGISSYSDSEQAQYNFIDSLLLRYAEAREAYDKYATVAESSRTAEKKFSGVTSVSTVTMHNLLDYKDRFSSIELTIEPESLETNESVETHGLVPVVCAIFVAFLLCVYWACRFEVNYVFLRQRVLSRRKVMMICLAGCELLVLYNISIF